MGIGCSCVEDDKNPNTWLEKKFTCVIGVAQEVEIKTIIERIPIFHGINPANPSCSVKCI